MKHLTLLLLLSTSTSTAFSQDTAKHRIDLNAMGWIAGTRTDTSDIWDTAGVTLITNRADTLRAIILVTMCPNCLASARMGFVVIEQGKRPVYLDCNKRALKGSQVGWDFREVGGKER